MSRMMVEDDGSVYRVRVGVTYNPGGWRTEEETMVKYLGPYRTPGAAKAIRSKEISDRKYFPHIKNLNVQIQVAHFEWEDFDA